MSHLSAERLAALADAGESPRPEEASHLAQCAHCTADRHAYAALVAGAAAERRTIAAPLTTWEGIAAGLRAEGLLAPPAARARPASLPRRMIQVAAALALLAGGVAAGRMSAVAGPLAVASANGVATRAPDASRPAPDAARDALVPDYRSAAEAEAALERYEVAYQHAAAYLAGNDTTMQLDATEDYRTRLVALDRASRTMREAMEEAPYDPVLTGYYLTTLGQREATLRQLNVAVPAGARLNSF